MVVTINHEDEKQRRISDLVTFQLNFESDVTESSLMLIPYMIKGLKFRVKHVYCKVDYNNYCVLKSSVV